MKWGLTVRSHCDQINKSPEDHSFLSESRERIGLQAKKKATKYKAFIDIQPKTTNKFNAHDSAVTDPILQLFEVL